MVGRGSGGWISTEKLRAVWKEGNTEIDNRSWSGSSERLEKLWTVLKEGNTEIDK